MICLLRLPSSGCSEARTARGKWYTVNVANQDNTDKIKVVSKVSDPPVLSSADLSRIQQESRHLHDAFTARTASMEILTVDDLKVRTK